MCRQSVVARMALPTPHLPGFFGKIVGAAPTTVNFRHPSFVVVLTAALWPNGGSGAKPSRNSLRAKLGVWLWRRERRDPFAKPPLVGHWGWDPVFDAPRRHLQGYLERFSILARLFSISLTSVAETEK